MALQHQRNLGLVFAYPTAHFPSCVPYEEREDETPEQKSASGRSTTCVQHVPRDPRSRTACVQLLLQRLPDHQAQQSKEEDAGQDIPTGS